MQDRLQERYAQLRAARDRGIPIAVGTDNMQGLLHIDIFHLVDASFTPIQAISVSGRTDQNIYDLTGGASAD